MNRSMTLRRFCGSIGLESRSYSMMSLDVTRIGARAGQQITVGIVRMADADVPIGVEYALLRKDTIGCNKVLDESGIDRARCLRECGSKHGSQKQSDGCGRQAGRMNQSIPLIERSCSSSQAAASPSFAARCHRRDGSR